MNYYFDTEFIEGPQDKKIFGFKYSKTKPTIDLISIGIVSEEMTKPASGEGTIAERSYYAISNEFNVDEAWNRLQPYTVGGLTSEIYWIRENILRPIFKDWQKISELNALYEFNLKNFKKFLNCFSKSNKQIAKEIEAFVKAPSKCKVKYEHEKSLTGNPVIPIDDFDINFYAYYADYDWVVFCWLFGIMMDLPKGFPWYCKDLKQISDELFIIRRDSYYGNNKDDMIKNSRTFLNKMSDHPDYPKQENEHNALDDARWNKKLHDFLLKYTL